MAFSIPTYEIHVRPNHEHGSNLGTNNNHLWLLHTSPSAPIGNWGGVACRGVDTGASYEYWHAFEFMIASGWVVANQGEFGTMIPDFHTKVAEVPSMPGPGPYYLAYLNGNVYVQLQAEFPNHSRQVAASLSKGVWHSVLARIIMGRTDGSVSASGHPNGGMGRIFLWFDGNDIPFDSGNVTTLYRTSGGVVQSKLDILEGFYTRNCQQDDVFSMTAGRWGKTVSECLADSSITLTGTQIANVYRGTGLNLGPSSYTVLGSRQDTNFLVPPQFSGVPAPPPPGPGGAQISPWADPIQWNSAVPVDPPPDNPPTVIEQMIGPWGDPIQWDSTAAPVGTGGAGLGGRFFKRFHGPARLADVVADLYTVPTGKRATIRHIHVSNPGVPSNPTIQSVDFTLSIGTDAAATRLWDGYPIAIDNLIQHFRDHALSQGEKIQAYASVSNVLNLTVEGYEESLEAQASTDIYGEGAYGDETYGT